MYLHLIIKMSLMYLKEIMENFQAFCNQTSLHGWQYITQRQGTQGFWSGFKHIFWSVIVCVAMGCAAIFLYNNTIDFMNATVVTTVDTMTVPLSEVFFPSVVVCNINQVRKSFFAELGIYDNETFIRQVYFDFILGKANTTMPHDGENEKSRSLHEQIMKEYLARHNETLNTKKSITWFTHQDCADMFILSKWNGTKTFHFKIIRDFGTDYGICCWYTPQINFTLIEEETKKKNLHEPDWGYWFMNVPKGAKTGKDNGYTMLFDIESFDYSYYDEGSEGLKLALVHHLDMPIMRQKGFHIAPGTENQIAVTPTLMSTSPNAMTRFTPEERDCYSEEEISLKYLPKDHGYRYEMSNCLFEAAFENILSECKCAPGFHMMGGDEAMERYDICLGPNLTCMNDRLNRMGEFDYVEYEGKHVKCRSNCEDQVNSLFVTTSSYPNKKTLIYREEFCIITKRLLEKCKTHKKKPLERQYPGICDKINPLSENEFCFNNEWKIPKTIGNCTNDHCPMVDEILNYARDNLVMFNIFIKDPYAKRFQKDEKITKTSYIANSGGLLGLCMGFSLVSAAEILYHCLFGLFSPLCGRNRRQGKDRLYQVYVYDRDMECARHHGVDDRDRQIQHVTYRSQRNDAPPSCAVHGPMQADGGLLNGSCGHVITRDHGHVVAQNHVAGHVIGQNHVAGQTGLVINQTGHVVGQTGHVMGQGGPHVMDQTGHVMVEPEMARHVMNQSHVIVKGSYGNHPQQGGGQGGYASHPQQGGGPGGYGNHPPHSTRINHIREDTNNSVRNTSNRTREDISRAGHAREEIVNSRGGHAREDMVHSRGNHAREDIGNTRVSHAREDIVNSRGNHAREDIVNNRVNHVREDIVNNRVNHVREGSIDSASKYSPERVI